MWGALGIGLAELMLIRTPSVVLEFSARGGFWLVNQAYEWCYPTLSETQKMQIQLNRIQFEIGELKNPEWTIVDESNTS